jgi:hypothetical protein
MVSLHRNQVVTLKRKEVVRLSGISTYGISQPIIQSLGSAFNQPIWASFSPNGEKYGCAFDNGRRIDLLDFDRCSGTFSNYLQLNNPDTNSIWGCSFSPNSQVLYMSTIMNLYQFDLTSINVDSSIMFISTWNGFTDPYMTAFCMQQLAPDGKIYITGWGGVQYLHVINFPDSIGASCDVRQHSIQLPGRNNGTMPNYPYYDLGAVHASICDSLPTNINSSIVSDNIISFFPNPCQDKLYFNLDLANTFNTNFNLNIKNSLGQIVANYSFSHLNSNNFTIDLSFLPSGLYEFELQSNSRIYTDKFLKN